VAVEVGARRHHDKTNRCGRSQSNHARGEGLNEQRQNRRGEERRGEERREKEEALANLMKARRLDT